MRTVLYTGIHQKNNGIIAWEYNWENKLFSLLFEKSEIHNIRDCEKKSVNKILL